MLRREGRRLGRTDMPLAAGFLALALLGAPGCREGVRQREDEERRTPMMTAARAKETQGDLDEAIRLYQDALDRNGTLGRAHLDLALLLHDYREDYVGAIYHYRRYLELRPDSEKTAMIVGRLRHAEQELAAALAKAGTAGLTKIPAPREAATPARGTAKPAKRGTVKPVVATPAPARKRTYVVKSGDTLSIIAEKVYQDRSQWTLIANANRAILGDTDKLQVGQELAIP